MEKTQEEIEGIELRECSSPSIESPIVHSPRLVQRKSSGFVITDFITSVDEISRNTLGVTQPSTRSQRCLENIKLINPSLWAMLTLLGILCATFGFCFDLAEEKIIEGKLSFAEYMDYSWFVVCWTTISVLFGVTAVLFVLYLSPEAEGSGIPQVKDILSGGEQTAALCYRNLVAKVSGLLCALTAGLSIGKEGPFVLISAVICDKLCRVVPCFQSIGKDRTMHMQALAAAVAAGICASFGAPIGGVLFSIEVTATFYIVSNLWKGIYCAAWCALMYEYLHVTSVTDLIDESSQQKIDCDWQILNFAVMGVVAGGIGRLFVRSIAKLVLLRKKGAFWKFSHPYVFTIIVCILCSLVTCSSPVFMWNDKYVYEQVMKSTSLADSQSAKEWTEPYVFFNLAGYVVTKLFITVISISTPVPCGLFTPVFTAGAVFGRLWGEVSYAVFGTASIPVYSLVGAACLTSSVTHTLSVAMIVFELTGQVRCLLYMLTGALVSYAIAIGPSVYDVMARLKGINYLPQFKVKSLYTEKLAKLMKTRFPVLTPTISVGELIFAIHKSPVDLIKLPVTEGNWVLLGDARLDHLEINIWNEFQSAKVMLPSNFGEMLSQVLAGDEETWEEVIRMAETECGVQAFLDTGMGFEIDEAPVVVGLASEVMKVHFLFYMLGLNQVYVVHKGSLKAQIDNKILLGNLKSSPMSSVWIALDQTSNEEVVLKLFPQGCEPAVQSEGALYRTLAPSQYFPQLRDQRLHSVFQTPESTSRKSYLVLRKAPYGDLFSLLTHTPFLSSLIRRFLMDVVTGIDLIHKAGWLHNNLRLENLLLGELLQVQIGGFGKACLQGRPSSNLKEVICVAPEIREGRSGPTPASDVFSCGIALLCMAVRTCPIRTSSRRDTFYKHVVNKNFPLFWKPFERFQLEDAFKELVAAMLAFEPSERPTIKQIKEHPWMNGPLMTDIELSNVLDSSL